MFIPHAVLLAIWYLRTAEGPNFPGTDIAFVITAALLPIWAAWLGRKKPLLRTLVLGPGLALAGGVAWWIQMTRGDGWLGAMLLAAGLLVFSLYSAIVFAIAARLRRPSPPGETARR